jgi:uncharacterized membrane protein YbhN (UPF0104 family)
MKKRHVVFGIKIVITAVLLIVLIHLADFSKIREAFVKMGPLPIFFAILSVFTATFLNTVRWRTILSLSGIFIPLSHLFLYNVSYTFYTVVLPGGRLSAEAVRLFQVLHDAADPRVRLRVAFSAFIDRVSALGSFFLIVLAFLFFHQGVGQLTLPVVGAVLFLGVVAIACTLFLSSKWTFSIISKFFPGVDALPSAGSFFMAGRSRLLALIGVGSISFAADIVLGLGVYVLVWGLGFHTAFGPVLFAFSLGMVSSFIPLSLAGIGIREGMLVYVLVTVVGIPLDAAVFVSFIALFSSLTVAALGAVVEFRRHFLRPALQKLHKEQDDK